MSTPEKRLNNDLSWNPERVEQQSPGRKPWESMQSKDSALKGRRKLSRPFRAGIPNVHNPRAYALGFAAAPLRGLTT